MFLTLVNYGRRSLQTSPDKWWRVQHFLRLSAVNILYHLIYHIFNIIIILILLLFIFLK